jgi:RNA 2',3'-cyclic 3'-phosphodiesterase
MRLFTGVDLSDEVRERLERLLVHLRPAAHLKWSPVYNLHITLKFIGEWPEARLPELEAALRTVPLRAPMNIDVRGLGWFPNAHSPRVFWVAVHSDHLEALARDTEAALEPLGIAKENRAFTAHLTLARIKDPAPLRALKNVIAQLESADCGSFTPDRFHLYRSQPGSAGSIYTKLSDYPFQTK